MHHGLDVAALCRLLRAYADEIAASDYDMNPWSPETAPKLQLGSRRFAAGRIRPVYGHAAVSGNLCGIDQAGTAHRAVATPGVSTSSKSIYIPAITRTVARQIEIARTAKCRLPRCEPMMPPTIAAAAKNKAQRRNCAAFVK